MSGFNLKIKNLEEKFRRTKNVLEMVSVLLAFINTYGPLLGLCDFFEIILLECKILYNAE